VPSSSWAPAWADWFFTGGVSKPRIKFASRPPGRYPGPPAFHAGRLTTVSLPFFFFSAPPSAAALKPSAAKTKAEVASFEPRQTALVDLKGDGDLQRHVETA
jgi:hypothetical protein